jgi:aspartyl protease family protein
MRGLRLTFVLILTVLASVSFAGPDVVLSGLFNDKAVLTINGVTKVMNVGQTSPDGVTLVACDRQSALLLVDGQEIEMIMSTQISSAFRQPEKAEVRIPKGAGGHYFVYGYINGHRIQFMVDTGATNVAMSVRDAERYGIRYQSGQKIQVATAAGVVDAYSIKLNSLTIGGIKRHGIEASILPGNFPNIPLLGNSFLNLVEINQKQGVLVLKSKL